jgi:hypothetical protein
MAQKKIAITQTIVNNKTLVVAAQTVDTEVIDGNVVAVKEITNPGVVYSNQK